LTNVGSGRVADRGPERSEEVFFVGRVKCVRSAVRVVGHEAHERGVGLISDETVGDVKRKRLGSADGLGDGKWQDDTASRGVGRNKVLGDGGWRGD
jgi:hypothetical protein